jgi:hypothetical protein
MTPEESQFLEESVSRIPNAEDYDDYGWVVICTLLGITSRFSCFQCADFNSSRKVCLNWISCFQVHPYGLYASQTLMFTKCRYKPFIQEILLGSWLTTVYNFSLERLFMRDR